MRQQLNRYGQHQLIACTHRIPQLKMLCLCFLQLYCNNKYRHFVIMLPSVRLILIVSFFGMSQARALKGKLLDDMMILEDIDDFTSNQSHPHKLWEFGIVNYEISSELYSYKGLIEKAMQQISSQVHHCVFFQERTDQENYVYITKGDGCNSHVGMIGGMQELHLDYGCFDMGNIIHELMHALGFFHEHSRPDRDTHLNIFLENVIKTKKNNFIKFNQTQYRFLSPEFDFDSIMIYGEYAFTKNGAPTMRPKDWLFGHRIINPDQKTSLSKMDVRGLKMNYKC